MSPEVLVASEWSWRLLLIGAGLYGLVELLSPLAEIVIPVLVALLLSALLHPLVTRLTRARVPQGLAAGLALLAALLVIAGLLALVGEQINAGFGDLRSQAIAGARQLQDDLSTSRLHLTSSAISGYLDRAQAAATDSQSRVLSGALGVATTFTQLLAGLFITLFSTFFFLSSGRRIWGWLLALLPAGARRPMDDAGRSGWVTLTQYIRATAIVAVVDGLGVGVGCALLGVPLALPLGVVVFLGAFIPIVGAVAAGILAVLVALVASGPGTALAVLGVLIAVNQLEAHILQPFLLGRAVSVHPLAVILSLAAGAKLAGVPGALFAVPLVAVANTMITSLARRDASPGGPPDPGLRVARDDAPLSPTLPAPARIAANGSDNAS